MDKQQVNRVARKVDALVDSGQEIHITSKEALWNLRQAEAAAASKHRRKPESQFRRLWRLLFERSHA